MNSLKHTHTRTHTDDHTHSHTETLSLSLTHTHSLSRTRTLSHAHTHPLSHTLSLYRQGNIDSVKMLLERGADAQCGSLVDPTGTNSFPKALKREQNLATPMNVPHQVTRSVALSWTLQVQPHFRKLFEKIFPPRKLATPMLYENPLLAISTPRIQLCCPYALPL